MSLNTHVSTSKVMADSCIICRPGKRFPALQTSPNRRQRRLAWRNSNWHDCLDYTQTPALPPPWKTRNVRQKVGFRVTASVVKNTMKNDNDMMKNVFQLVMISTLFCLSDSSFVQSTNSYRADHAAQAKCARKLSGKRAHTQLARKLSSTIVSARCITVD